MVNNFKYKFTDAVCILTDSRKTELLPATNDRQSHNKYTVDRFQLYRPHVPKVLLNGWTTPTMWRLYYYIKVSWIGKVASGVLHTLAPFWIS